jgi:hypothetical protein
LEELRKRIAGEEFDYQALLDGLREYDCPRDKITALLKKGMIIRVKKGIYIFGESYRRRPFSRELLANMIYGPSYISLDTALHHHGLIPERVEAMMSVTEGRGRRFFTPWVCSSITVFRSRPTRPGSTRWRSKGDDPS